MIEPSLSAQASEPGADLLSATDQESVVRMVPLKFWFGPKRIWSAKLRLLVENVEIDPAGNAQPTPPRLAELEGDTNGVHRPSEPLAADMPILSNIDGGIRYVESSFRRRYIDMTIGFEGYLSSFSGRTRSTLKRKMRKFQSASGDQLEWTVYRGAAEMEQFHQLAREISKLTYQEKLFDAGIPDDEAFRTRMRELAEADCVRAFILFMNGKPVSYLYLPIVERRVIYGFLGFDPSFAKHSPGTVLQLIALEFLFGEEKYSYFDFTEGEGEHKRLFATMERYCGNVFYLRGTMRNRLLVHAHRTIRRLSDFADSLIVRSGLKERLRQMLRGQSAAQS